MGAPVIWDQLRGGERATLASADWLLSPPARRKKLWPEPRAGGDAVLQGCPAQGQGRAGTPGPGAGSSRASKTGVCAAGGLESALGQCMGSAVRKSQRLGEDCPVSRLALMIPFWVLGDHCAPLGLNRELGRQPLRGRGSRTTWQLSQRGPWSSPRPPSSVVSGRSWHPELAGLAQDTQPAGVACGATAQLCLAKPADLGESAGRGHLCPGRCLVTLSHVESRAASSRAGEWGVG